MTLALLVFVATTGCGGEKQSSSKASSAVTALTTSNAPASGYTIELTIEAPIGSEFSVSGNVASEKEFTAPGERVIGFPRRTLSTQGMSHTWDAPTNDLDVVVDDRKASRRSKMSCSIAVTDATGQRKVYTDDNGGPVPKAPLSGRS
jgi:hypothetical protein